MNLLARTYAALLHLYPHEFREEFGDEMCTVFSEALAETGERSGMALLAVCWREVRDLPIALWQEHALHHREVEMIEETNSSDWSEDRGSWRETVLGQNVFGVAIRNLSPYVTVMALILIVPLWGAIDMLRARIKRGRAS